ncbi:MAG: peptide chain release factor N(5)-glutamine methyltransferase, partial [Candidatus Abyssubacteria bacterium]|nr:peptide chain release factor N(5)-glutamine methyltransferase [Candidatus Abyssubacteria bacterium]
GTGCGCIAVSLALLMPHASIHAVDISEGAVELARHNAGRHGVGSRIAFHVGSFYSALPQSLKGRVDVIVSNPPYVSDAEHAVLDRSIRDFEPALALRGGRDGLDVFGRIAAGAADFLTGGGLLASEIGESQAEKATAILETIGSFVEIETVRDLGGRSRVMTGRKRT